MIYFIEFEAEKLLSNIVDVEKLIFSEIKRVFLFIYLFKKTHTIKGR